MDIKQTLTLDNGNKYIIIDLNNHEKYQYGLVNLNNHELVEEFETYEEFKKGDLLEGIGTIVNIR